MRPSKNPVKKRKEKKDLGKFGKIEFRLKSVPILELYFELAVWLKMLNRMTNVT